MGELLLQRYFPFRIHFTAPDEQGGTGWVWPPYTKDEDPAKVRIVRFQWWKKATILLLFIGLLWSFWTRRYLVSVGFLVGPLFIHRLLVAFFPKPRSRDVTRGQLTRTEN